MRRLFSLLSWGHSRAAPMLPGGAAPLCVAAAIGDGDAASQTLIRVYRRHPGASRSLSHIVGNAVPVPSADAVCRMPQGGRQQRP